MIFFVIFPHLNWSVDEIFFRRRAPFIWLKMFYFFAFKTLVKNDLNHLIFLFWEIIETMFLLKAMVVPTTFQQTFAKIHSLVLSILFLAQLLRNVEVY